MICKNCSSEIPDYLASCPKCGSSTDINTQLFCQNCGARLNENDEFCTSCGKYTEKKKQEMDAVDPVNSSIVWLGFFLPIVGFIYAAINSKSHPATAKATFFASLFGFTIEASVCFSSIFYFI